MIFHWNAGLQHEKKVSWFILLFASLQLNQLAKHNSSSLCDVNANVKIWCFSQFLISATTTHRRKEKSSRCSRSNRFPLFIAFREKIIWIQIEDSSVAVILRFIDVLYKLDFWQTIILYIFIYLVYDVRIERYFMIGFIRSLLWRTPFFKSKIHCTLWWDQCCTRDWWNLKVDGTYLILRILRL